MPEQDVPRSSVFVRWGAEAAEVSAAQNAADERDYAEEQDNRDAPADDESGDQPGMPSQHKHPPITFRPPGPDREWLLAYAEETGQPVNRVLATALAAHRAALENSANGGSSHQNQQRTGHDKPQPEVPDH